MSGPRYVYRVRDARERLLSEGAHLLAEVELLSLLLTAGNKLCANDLASDLLARFGSLRALCVADRNETRVAGLSDANHARLQAALELTRRHYQSLAVVGDQLNSPRATREYLRMRMRDYTYEVFVCVYLDARYRVISFEELFRGTIDGAIVHPGEVVRKCLKKNASGVIVAHNHPSGVAEPSGDDRAITQRLRDALKLVDIALIDHLIVGDGVCESFAERGLL
jgi:DNA repair protein RadC